MSEKDAARRHAAKTKSVCVKQKHVKIETRECLENTSLFHHFLFLVTYNIKHILYFTLRVECKYIPKIFFTYFILNIWSHRQIWADVFAKNNIEWIIEQYYKPMLVVAVIVLRWVPVWAWCLLAVLLVFCCCCCHDVSLLCVTASKVLLFTRLCVIDGCSSTSEWSLEELKLLLRPNSHTASDDLWMYFFMYLSSEQY